MPSNLSEAKSSGSAAAAAAAAANAELAQIAETAIARRVFVQAVSCLHNELSLLLIEFSPIYPKQNGKTSDCKVHDRQRRTSNRKIYSVVSIGRSTVLPSQP